MNDKLVSLKGIDEIIKTSEYEDYPSLITMLETDDREGVKKRLKKVMVKYEALKKEYNRIEKLKLYEDKLHKSKMNYIAGMDEVGRGCLFGPVVTACVVMKKDSRILYVNDSKKLTPKKREELFEKIKKDAVAISIGMEDNNTIDEINILAATKRAMKKAVDSLCVKPDIILIDAVEIDTDIPQRHFFMGDENFYSIACASIIAKVTRDKMMSDLNEKYSVYHIGENKGYGTAAHIEALKKYGASDMHRKSFVKKFISYVPKVQKGREYEQTAKKILENEGLKYIASNYKRTGGEIDLIFYDDNSKEYVFCEVRYRGEGSYESALESISPSKIEKIKKCALEFMVEKSFFEAVRFDVVTFDKMSLEGKHIKDAF